MMISAEASRETVIDDRFEALYRSSIASSIRLAYLLTGDAATADDVAHDAFVRVAGRLRGFKNDGDFQSYLRTTIVNLAKDRWRQRQRSHRAFLTDAAGGARDEYLPDVETKDEVWRALSRLSPRRRTALVLRYYEGLSDQEIADVMSCSLSGAKSLVRRGLQSLREVMEVSDV